MIFENNDKLISYYIKFGFKKYSEERYNRDLMYSFFDFIITNCEIVKRENKEEIIISNKKRKK